MNYTGDAKYDSNVGRQQTGGDVGRDRTVSEMIADNLSERSAQFEKMLSRLDRLSERLHGPRPREVGKPSDGAIVQAKPSFTARIEMIDSTFRRQIEEADRIINQLESFI